MKFYIATGLERVAAHNIVRNELLRLGHELTYDWTKHGSVQKQPAHWSRIAQLEIEGVKNADAVIVLLPGGRGTHTELGMAIAMGIPILIHGSLADLDGGRTCIFYHHEKVTLCLQINLKMWINSLDLTNNTSKLTSTSVCA